VAKVLVIDDSDYGHLDDGIRVRSGAQTRCQARSEIGAEETAKRAGYKPDRGFIATVAELLV
jgi:hypothetical protein